MKSQIVTFIVWLSLPFGGLLAQTGIVGSSSPIRTGDNKAQATYSDYPTALTAANQGDSQAQYTLGAWYEHGFNVPKDLLQARAWYTKAAQQGGANALAALVQLDTVQYQADLKNPDFEKERMACCDSLADEMSFCKEHIKFGPGHVPNAISDESNTYPCAWLIKALAGESGNESELQEGRGVTTVLLAEVQQVDLELQAQLTLADAEMHRQEAERNDRSSLAFRDSENVTVNTPITAAATLEAMGKSGSQWAASKLDPSVLVTVDGTKELASWLTAGLAVYSHNDDVENLEIRQAVANTARLWCYIQGTSDNIICYQRTKTNFIMEYVENLTDADRGRVADAFLQLSRRLPIARSCYTALQKTPFDQRAANQAGRCIYDSSLQEEEQKKVVNIRVVSALSGGRARVLFTADNAGKSFGGPFAGLAVPLAGATSTVQCVGSCPTLVEGSTRGVRMILIHDESGIGHNYLTPVGPASGGWIMLTFCSSQLGRCLSF